MLAPRESPELGPWEIFGLSLLGAGILGAGAVSWHWARQGPPHAAALHPGGAVPTAVPTPNHPAPGSKSTGYDPSWGPTPAADDWTQPPTTGPGYEVRRPKRTWGTKASVASVVEAMGRFATRRDELGIVERACKKRRLDTVEPPESPENVDDPLHKNLLDGSNGLVMIPETFTEFGESFRVFLWKQQLAREEAVAEEILRAPRLALLRTWARRIPGVPSVRGVSQVAHKVNCNTSYQCSA